MTKFSLLALPLIASGLLLTGCTGEVAVYDDTPAYYGGGGGSVYVGNPNPDFYYTGANPYSRQYGVLVYRDNGYYYRRGNSWVVYGRPAWNRYDYDRYQRDNWRSYRGRRDTRVVVREEHNHRHNNNNNRKRNDRVAVKETNQGTRVSYDTNNNRKHSNKQQASNNSNKKKNQGSGGGGSGKNKNKKKNQDENKKKKNN